MVGIAVIIPAYNAASTIDAALSSVAAQSVQPAEVIVADDGSTDGTATVVRGWADKLPLTVLDTGGPLGPSSARHAAIEKSTSELVALLDADDVWLPDHVDAMRTAYDTTADGLASADALAWIPEATIAPRPLSGRAPLPPAHRQLGWLLTENYLSISALFSRARYDAVGGFRPQFRGTEDWDLWIRMVRAGAVVVRPDHATVLYRLTRAGVSSDDAMIAARRAVLDAAAAEGGAGERRALRTGLRRNHAAAQLAAAYRCAEDGRTVAARIAGARAVRGIRPVAVRGLAMAVAPRRVARRRAEQRFEPSVWLRRYGA